MDDPLTPQEFATKMRDIIDSTKGDPEVMHGMADDLMEEMLSALGYREGVALLYHTTRWSA